MFKVREECNSSAIVETYVQLLTLNTLRRGMLPTEELRQLRRGISRRDGRA